jgi:Glu-tRNA(Gln) amidotransferase subunit E-like FAD-binding protein
LGKEPENILQQSYWNNLIPLIHSRIERKSGRLYKGLLTKISIPAAATILAIVVLVRVFTGSRPEALPVYNTQSVLNNIIAELRTSDVTNMSLEELNLLSNLEQKGDNGSDKYVINKILNEQKSVVESDYVNMESALKIMDDDELNKLITYLDQSQN